MIVSLEGSRQSGKTYMSKYLKENLLSDYEFLPSDKILKTIRNKVPCNYSAKDKKIHKAQFWFLDQTELKFKEASDPNKIYVFQRDYLSHLAFAYAHSKTYHSNSFNDIFAEVISRLNSKKYQKPHLRLVFDNNYTLFCKRAKSVKNKPIEEIWYDRVFSENLFQFYRKYALNDESDVSVLVEPMHDVRDLAKMLQSYIKRTR